MNIRQFSNAYLFSSEARPNIVHLALILTFSLPAQAPQPPVDLYSRAMAAKNGELPAAPPEFAAVNAAIRSYVSCAVDCSAPLAEFTTRLCALAPTAMPLRLSSTPQPASGKPRRQLSPPFFSYFPTLHVHAGDARVVLLQERYRAFVRARRVMSEVGVDGVVLRLREPTSHSVGVACVWA